MAYIYFILFIYKNITRIKDNWSSFSGTSDKNGHVQGHVTLTYKVKLDSYSVEFNFFDIRDPKNLQNKKRSSL